LDAEALRRSKAVEGGMREKEGSQEAPVQRTGKANSRLLKTQKKGGRERADA